MNYVKFKSLLWTKYYYADCKDYLADSLFYKRKIPIRFFGEYQHPDKKYIVIVCKVRNKYQKDVEDALKELFGKMELLGWNDYGDFCNEMKPVFDIG